MVVVNLPNRNDRLKNKLYMYAHSFPSKILMTLYSGYPTTYKGKYGIEDKWISRSYMEYQLGL